MKYSFLFVFGLLPFLIGCEIFPAIETTEQPPIPNTEGKLISPSAREFAIPDMEKEDVEISFPNVSPPQSSWKVITEFYNALKTKNLEKAYAMGPQNVSFDTFRSWYENVTDIQLFSKNQLPDYSYAFDVILTEHGFIKNKYQVVMSTDDEKILSSSSKKITPPYCTQEPIPLAIGSNSYPKAPEYAHLHYLGQLFSAAECSLERVNHIFGVRNGFWTLRSQIKIKSENSWSNPDLVDTLRAIGARCDQDSATPPPNCDVWSFDSTKVPLLQIMKLKPFAPDIFSDGCINCG